MKWNTNKTARANANTEAKEKLASKAVLDDVLEQISGGARSNCCHCQIVSEVSA
jgi:hypothetical protein